MKKNFKYLYFFLILILFFSYRELLSQTESYYFKIPSNQIKFFIIPDYSLPLSGLSVFYKCGSSIDPINKKGIMNIIKYLMFSKTENLASDEFLFFFFNIGGKVDAILTKNYLQFYDVFPAVYMNSVLWLERERIKGLKFGNSDLERAKKLAIDEINEKRRKTINLFYEKIESLILKDKNGYDYPSYGVIDNIRKIKLEDVKNFYKTKFKPSEKTIITIGPFEAKNLRKQLYSFFSKLVKSKSLQKQEEIKILPVKKNFLIPPVNNNYIYSKIFILPPPTSLKQYLIYRLFVKTIEYSLNGEILKKLPASSKFDVRLRFIGKKPILYSVIYDTRKLNVFKSKYILDYTVNKLTSSGIDDNSFKVSLNNLLTELLSAFQMKDRMLAEIGKYYDLSGKVLLKDQFYFTLLRINKLDLYREANKLLKNRGIKIEAK